VPQGGTQLKSLANFSVKWQTANNMNIISGILTGLAFDKLNKLKLRKQLLDSLRKDLTPEERKRAEKEIIDLTK